MSSSPFLTPEPRKMGSSLEDRLQRAASVFPYPETPNLAARERQRVAAIRGRVPSRKPSRLAVGLVILLIIVGAALFVSPVRARVLDWIRIGSVRIFFTQPTPTATVSAPKNLPVLPGTPSPVFTPTVIKSVLNIGGETTLSKAQERARFTIQLPAYPESLGSPDHVYLQEMNGPVVVLVWMDPLQPDQVRMSLSESPSNRMVFEKYVPKSVQDTQVDGHAAVWIDGEYLLAMRNGDMSLTRLITQSHTLIWTVAEMTYRLETDEDLATAIRIAESIQKSP